MSNLSIVKIYPENYKQKNSCLNIPTKEIHYSRFNTEELNHTILSMFKTLYSHSSGVGLAANQVGLSDKICVVDFKRDAKKPLALLNPQYYPLSDELILSTEQCMSFPNLSVTLNRYHKISVGFYNIKGEKKELVFEGFKAIVLQHEIDHLNGKTFLDYDNTHEYYIGYSNKIAQKALEVLISEE